jgi:ribosomal protein L11 methyltransferase
LQASKANAERNNVSDRLSLYLPKDQPELKADVVVANILAGPLRELAPVIMAFVKPKGLLALSGILESQAQELQINYGQWCEMQPIEIKEEWVRLSGQAR